MANEHGVGDEAEHARLLLETANDAFVSADEAGTIVEWNRAAEDVFGWTKAEAIGQRLVDTVVPPRYRAAHEAGVRAWLETGEGPVLFRTVELPARHRDGHEIPSELTIWPSSIGGRRRMNAFLRDVTDRVRSSEYLAVLQRVTEAANAADDLERAIRTALVEVASLTGWPVGHAYVRGWRHDPLAPTGWWTAGSAAYPAFREATEHAPFAAGRGLPGRVAASGRPGWIADLASDPNFPRGEAAREAGLRVGVAFPVLSEDRVVAVLEFYAEEAAAPDQQTLELMANIGIQLGRVFERLRWRAELREAVSATTRALSMIAHEVRTPVFTIEGYASLAQQHLDPETDATALDHLAVIQRHAARLQRLVSKALLASKLESRSEAVQARDVPLASFLPRIVADLHVDDVAIEGETDLVVVADPDHLEQILGNYLANAHAYGRPPVWIDVEADREADPERGGAAVIRVCDRGPGVARAFVPDLFRSFHRGGAGGSGAGLGLSIARELAELNGGDAWYEPVAPTGSSFVVRLPLSPSVSRRSAR